MIVVDKELFYAIAEKDPHFENIPLPTWEHIKQYEKLWKDMCGYDGCETWKIDLDLKEKGWSKKQILGFKIFYTVTGIQEGWLLDELFT